MSSPPAPVESAPPTGVPPPTFSPPPAPTPPASSPPPPSSSPPPVSPPPPSFSPPPSSPPPTPSSPPPNSPPPPKNDPPPASPPPVPTSSPPASPPPSPTSPPPALSPPPPIQNPEPPPSQGYNAKESPPQPPEPPKDSSPSPPSPSSPPSPPSPSSSNSPSNSPPSPASQPQDNSPPSPTSTSGPPNDSPPSPASSSPSASPSSDSSSGSSPPPPSIQLSPPPSNNGTQPSRTPLPPPPPSRSSVPSSDSSSHTGHVSGHHPALSSKSAGGDSGTAGTISIGIIVVLLLLGIIGTAGWCIRKRNKKNAGQSSGLIKPISVCSSPKSESALLKVEESTPETNGTSSNFINSPADPCGFGSSKTWFTYKELVEATNDFSEQNLLGKGGFGSVYKGCLPDGRYVAVKQLNIGGGQGEREFRAEVEIISRIHHRHLVSLVGYCISENKRLLVYDYVSNNTLYFHLHEKGRPVMNWATRVKIAVGAARGIAYLHEDCYPRIIHRDIKSSNILLDNNFDARVADFGLAKLAQDAESHVTTRVVGTFGYMAPEYASTGKLTEKSDIYSFGVVLLELITGRKPVDNSQPSGEENLVDWARPLLSRALQREEFDEVADPHLEKNYVGSEMFRMIEAAASCVRHSSAKRPAMGQIMRAFDGMAMHDLSNGTKVGDSAIYGSALESAEMRWFQRMAFGNQDLSSNFFSEGTQNSRESGVHG